MTRTVHFFPKGPISIPSSKYRAHLVRDRINETASAFDAVCHEPSTTGFHSLRRPGGVLTELREGMGTHRQLRSVADGDIVYCQRTVYKRFRALRLLACGQNSPLVFDFDDAVYLHHPALTRWFITRADLVVAGNHFLKKYAEFYTDDVALVPTGVPDTYLSTDRAGEIGDPFRIGWVGNGSTHRENLIAFADTLATLEDINSDLQVHLVGVRDVPEVKERFRDLQTVRATFTDWIPAEQYTERAPELISTFDVGVMPLRDTMFNRGKSALKLLEYMAMGVPVIASPVGENRYLVEDGCNGFLADTTADWTVALEQLQKPERHEQMAERARETVAERYTISAVTDQLLDLFRDL